MPEQQCRRRVHQHRPDRQDDRQGRLARPRSRRRCAPSWPSAPTPTRNLYVDAAHIVTALLGNAVTANVFMVGVAYQAGFIPLPGEAIERAIELNGTAVEANLSAFRWGRRWTVDPDAVEKAAGASIAYELEPYAVDGIDDAVAPRARRAPRRRPRRLPEPARTRRDTSTWSSRRISAELKAGGDGSFAATVARQLHHVMAYKDEYEVARLLLAGRGKVAAQFGDDAKMTWNLYPPMLRSMGLGHKLRFGRVVDCRCCRRCARMKGLRGTPFDPFGHSKVRRTERAMVKEYISSGRRGVDDVGHRCRPRRWSWSASSIRSAATRASRWPTSSATATALAAARQSWSAQAHVSASAANRCRRRTR